MQTDFTINPGVPASLNVAWLALLSELLGYGHGISPRGQATLELPQHTLVVNMRKPVLTIPERKLNYRFMAAEARWILTGDDRVETIAPYNSKIAGYSDDGYRFFGAYGPRWIEQRPYVVQKLIEDHSTRQAGVTFWRPNPPATKDVPCTVAVFFQLRHSKLNCHVFMRSNDAWLGTPYDVFNFSMLAHQVCGLLHERTPWHVEPGAVFLTAASAHLYEQHYEAARMIVAAADDFPIPRDTPAPLFEKPSELWATLCGVADDPSNGPFHRWWL